MELRGSHRAIVVLLAASASLLAVSRILASIALPMPRAPSSPPTFTYRGRDFPSSWPIAPLAEVKLFHEDGVHYELETELGIAEWKAILPSGGPLLYLGPDYRPFTLSMFHQLRCLDILRDVLVDFYYDQSPNATYKQAHLAHHCMNYLRQTVMCRANLRLENVRAPSGPQVTVSSVSHSCKDWTMVYDAAEDNYRDYLLHSQSRNTV